MEKYAIDIDKVLDEFEAQETDIFNSVASLVKEDLKNCNALPPCKEKIQDSSKTDEAFSFSINSESYDNYFSQIADKNLKQLLDGSSVCNSEIRVVSEEKILENCLDSPEKLSLFDNTKDSKLLNFDIFFKQLGFDHLESVVSTNKNPSNVLSAVLMETDSDLEDKKLCVPVNEVSPKPYEVSESESEKNDLYNEIEKSEIYSLSESPDNNVLNVDCINSDIQSCTKNFSIKKCFSNDRVLELSKVDRSSQISEQYGDCSIEISFPISPPSSLQKKETSVPHEVINNLTHLNVIDSLKNLSISAVGIEGLSLKEKLVKNETIVSVTDASKVNREDQFTCNKSEGLCEDSLSVDAQKVEDKNKEYCLPCDLEMCPTEETSSNRLSLGNIVPVRNPVEQNVESYEENFAQNYIVPVVASEQADSLFISIGENKLLLTATSVTENCHVSTSESGKTCEVDIYSISNDSPNISKIGDSGISSQEAISDNIPQEIPYTYSSNSVDSKNYDNERAIIHESVPIKNYRDVENRNNWVEETVITTGDYISYVSSPEIVNDKKVLTSNFEEMKFKLPNEALRGQNGSCFAAAISPKIDLSNIKVKKKSDRLKCSGKKRDVISSNFVPDNKLNVKNEGNFDSYNYFEGVPNTTAKNFTFSGIDSNLSNAKSVVGEVASVQNIGGDTPNLDERRKTGELLFHLQRPTSLNLHSIEKYPPFQNGTSELLVENASPVKPTHRINEVKKQEIGFVKPYWIPDSEAPNCMHCAIKFTVIRRRHHCRACGKVLCSRCCNQRAYLAYMNKEERTCLPCAEIISSFSPVTIQNDQLPNSPDSVNSSSSGSNLTFSTPVQTPSKGEAKPVWRPDPNNPDDYCSTISPLKQMELAGPNPTLLVWVPGPKKSSPNQESTIPENTMDSNVARNGRLIDIVDSSWREEKLPDEPIAVPAAELPDPEPDNGNAQETLREQEQKWADLALNKIHKVTPSTTTS